MRMIVHQRGMPVAVSMGLTRGVARSMKVLVVRIVRVQMLVI